MLYHTCSALIVAVACHFTFYTAECQDIKPLEIDNSDAGGLWYEIARTWNKIETSEKCVSFLNTPEENGFSSESSGIPEDSPHYIYFEATLVPNEEGINIYNTTANSPVNNKSINYLSQYLKFTGTCFIVKGYFNDPDKEDKYWIFSRTKQLTDDDAMKVNEVIADDEGLKNRKIIWIDNSDCGDEF